MVSIIVPVYNVAPYLERCLTSLVHQTWKELEVLLVDDGSIDGSGAICDRFARRDRRVKVFHVAHSGAAAARNYGIERARGEYFTFVDGDDSISRRYVETMVKELEKRNCQIVVCGRKEFLGKNGRQLKVFTAPKATVVSYEDYDCIGPYQHLTCWGALFNSALFQTGLRFDPAFKVSEDTLFFMEALKAAGEFAVLPEPLYFYSIREGSLTHGAYNWDYYTEMLAWKRIIALTSDQALRHRVNTRGWLARKCVLAIRRNWLYYNDKELNRLLMEELRRNIGAALVSTLPLKNKVGILLCATYPGFYLKLQGRRMYHI